MSTVDSRSVLLPSGRTLDFYRSRWDGVLDREEYDYCRAHGVALAYDCAQTGWVVGTCTDEIDGAATRHASRSAPEWVRPVDPERWADGLLRQARAAATRCVDDVLAGRLSLGDAECRLDDVVERTAAEFARAYGLHQADALQFALRAHMRCSLRELRGGRLIEAPATDDVTAFRFRRWTPDDANLYFDLLNNPELWRYLPEPFPSPFTPATALTLIEVGGIGFHHETVAVLVDDHPVGQCLLRFNRPFAGVRTAEVAYWLGEEHWGKGWMRRILPVFTARGFDVHEVDAIFAWIMTDNKASIRAAEAAGYRRDPWSLEPRLAESLGRADFVRYATYRADW